MVFLNPWILFGVFPLFLLYKRSIHQDASRQIKLLYSSLFFMLLALAQPALENSLTTQKFNSQDFIIAIDASYSMQADDLKPTRYDKAKQAIIKLLKTHPKDRFTIFAFTSNALLISPPTTDSEIGIQALDTLNPNYILTKSTNMYNLFKTISKIVSKDKKHLIVFSDGGDETDIDKLAQVLKRNNIVPYFVATATQKGAALKKEGKYLKDIHSSLVISKINPLLKDLAALGGGKYYELNSLQTIDTLSSDLSREAANKEQDMKVQSYKELFYIPLFIALILFFISVTKLHQLYIFVFMILFTPYKTEADTFDFYYLYKAKQNIKELKYSQAASNFKQLEPSVQSYYNIAGSFYKAGQYKSALNYYTKIKTPDKKLKEAILYNMGNCAVKLKMYDKAKEYYINALALIEDEDALYNLNLIRDKKTEKRYQVSKNSQSSSKKKKNSDTKQESKKQNKNANKSSSNRDAEQSSSGSGGTKKNKSASVKKTNSKNANNYKIGYKAYEIINKGYADEKEPW